MNTNAYNAGGAAPRPPLPSQEKLTFDPPRVPVILTPANVEPVEVPGKFGRQWKWQFVEGLAYFDPEVHVALIDVITGGARQVGITKKVTRGQPPTYEVQGVEDLTMQRNTPAQQAELAQRRIREETAKLEAARARPAAERMPAAAGEAFERWAKAGKEFGEVEGHPLMADALRDAINACQHAGFAASEESIIKLAITIFIEACKK